MVVNTSQTAPIVRKVLEYIKENNLKVGERLPSIRDLSKEWGYGRNAIRDGLVQAQSLGILTIHPRAGAFIRSLDFSPLVDALANGIEIALMQEDINILHLSQARFIIEPELAALAAKYRRIEDIFQLQEIVAKLRSLDTADRAEYVLVDEALHLAIAKIAGNPALTTILKALLVLLRPYRIANIPTQEIRKNTDEFHTQIINAIQSGDPNKARECMIGHILAHRIDLLAGIEENKEGMNGIFAHFSQPESGENNPVER